MWNMAPCQLAELFVDVVNPVSVDFGGVSGLGMGMHAKLWRGALHPDSHMVIQVGTLHQIDQASCDVQLFLICAQGRDAEFDCD